MDLVISLVSIIGVNGILLFFIKRFFDRRDKKEAHKIEQQERLAESWAKEQRDLYRRVNTGLETIRLLAYARMSEEIERLLTKGYATPAERRILDEMYHNYKVLVYNTYWTVAQKGRRIWSHSVSLSYHTK